MERDEKTKTDPLYNDMWNELHDKKRNLLISITGRPGAGKSYSALRLGEIFDDAFRNIDTKEKAEHILSTRVLTNPREFINAINTDKSLKNGSVLILDEAGIVMPSERWQSLNNQLLSHIFQSFRHMHLVVIFTLPNLKFLSIQARRLLHYSIIAQRIDFDEKRVLGKIKKFEANPESGKIYTKIPRFIHNGCRIKCPLIRFAKPSDLLCKVYEERAQTFKQSVAESVGEKLLAIENSENLKREQQIPVNFDELAQRAADNVINGVWRKITIPLLKSDYHLSHINSAIVRLRANRILSEKVFKKHTKAQQPLNLTYNDDKKNQKAVSKADIAISEQNGKEKQVII